MINAKEVKKLSDSYMSEKAQINEIEKQRKTAALDGKYGISVATLTDFALVYLTQHDYEITRTGYPRDRNGIVSYIIEWGIKGQYR